MIDTIHTYLTPSGPARCRLRIYPSTWSGGAAVVIASDLDRNSGARMTTAADVLATEVCARHGLRPQGVTWIEHLPGRGPSSRPPGATYERVEFLWIGGCAMSLRWSRLSPAEVMALVNEPGQPEELAEAARKSATARRLDDYGRIVAVHGPDSAAAERFVAENRWDLRFLVEADQLRAAAEESRR